MVAMGLAAFCIVATSKPETVPAGLTVEEGRFMVRVMSIKQSGVERIGIAGDGTVDLHGQTPDAASVLFWQAVETEGKRRHGNRTP